MLLTEQERYRLDSGEMARKGLLQRLSESVVIGDGGYNMILERRGYVRVGRWTPDGNVEHPEAVAQLHREFLRAGSDVLQGYTFNANDRKLARRDSTYRYEKDGKILNRMN